MTDKKYFVDEALAKGLAHRFVKDFYNDSLKVLNKRFFSSRTRLKTRNDFEHFINEHKEHFKNIFINYFIIGSERNPVIVFNLIRPVENRKFKDWTEDSLGSLVYTETVKDYFYATSPKANSTQFFGIGEHALSRLYQRSGLFSGPENFKKYEILIEFKYVPFWSNIWFLFLRTVLNPIPLERKLTISLYIPTENGLFICNPSKNISPEVSHDSIAFIDIRTYIHKDSLNPEQYRLREILIDISKNLINSPLAFWPTDLMQVSNASSNILFNIVVKRILKHVDLISQSFYEKSILNHVSDDFDIYNFKKNINQFKKDIDFDEYTDLDILESELCNIGIREFLIKYRELSSTEDLNFWRPLTDNE